MLEPIKPLGLCLPGIWEGVLIIFFAFLPRKVGSNMDVEI